MIRSEKNKIPTFETKAQQECYEVAIELHKRGLYYCPRDIGQSSAARALVSRGFLFRVDGVRHEESGNEVLGFGVVGSTYPVNISLPRPISATKTVFESKDQES